MRVDLVLDTDQERYMRRFIGHCGRCPFDALLLEWKKKLLLLAMYPQLDRRRLHNSHSGTSKASTKCRNDLTSLILGIDNLM